ncbi:hypothetical protein ACEWY4_025536 [Coilia grayii]|uniref:PiggyBac transposable element-derived protein domain-containing protein n=1 Tax=Coilia grayii TaxID=363190 RepID=A0ABD1IXV1_9TELE
MNRRLKMFCVDEVLAMWDEVDVENEEHGGGVSDIETESSSEDDENQESIPPPAAAPASELKDEHSEAQHPPMPPKRGTKRAPVSEQPSLPAEWKTECDLDSTPPPLRFRPMRAPGVQVDTTLKHTPLDLFKLFFTPTVVRELCNTTNKYAAENTVGKSYTWSDVDVQEFYHFLGMLQYASLVKLPSVEDYWTQEDEENDLHKGTLHHNRLFRVQPLFDHMRAACKSSYHPRRELAVDERMVATKAKTGFTQYIRNKPTKWGIKLYVMADSSNGYTVDFSIYTGKNLDSSPQGLSYDAVMDLVQPAFLGTGYHIYVDNFYTSPKLFGALADLKFGACGTYREGRKGCPSSQGVLTKKSPRGTVRWLRQDPVVFVKWMDTREVSMCSTIHPAYAGDTVRKKVKSRDGKYSVVEVPCPVPVLEYNKYMGGVDRSDQLIQYYSTRRRVSRSYRTLFLHFLDIANTNAYIMHLELSKISQQKSLTHKAFLSQLVRELFGVEKTGVPVKRQTSHLPVGCAKDFTSSNRATAGRRRCQHCSAKGVCNTTPWKCQACDVPLCLLLDRNCFAEWHA